MKITERDKVLLVLLGVILIVALAIVLPGVGVMACRDSLSAYANDTEEIQTELDTQLEVLHNMGVRRNTENPSRAKEELEGYTKELKVEASHLVGSIMAYAEPYAVDESWVDGLEYRYGAKSDEQSKIVSYNLIENVDPVESNVNETIVMDGVTHTLPSAKRTITYTVAETAACTYEVEMTMEGYSAADLGAILLFLHNIASKGSMLITDARIGGERTVSFTLLMPNENSGITRYAQEIIEMQNEEQEEEEE